MALIKGDTTMLIYDASQKSKIIGGGAELLLYLDKGVADAAPRGDFKEEDHPRGGKGSEEGGRFVKSEKTKRKEDEVDNLSNENEKEESLEEYYARQKRTLGELITEYKKSMKETDKRLEGESAEEYLKRAAETTKIAEKIDTVIERLHVGGYKVSGRFRRGENITISDPPSDDEESNEDNHYGD